MRFPGAPIESAYRASHFTEIFFLRCGERPQNGAVREINAQGSGEYPRTAQG
jgi:hypothetical protein